MASYKSEFFSIVFLGAFNPSILNHDFLVSNGIIPKDIEPFSSLLKNEPGRQFSEFISTPVMATIRYDKYSIMVEEQRYQIMDRTGKSPVHSPIILITKAYFGKFLKYTPLRIGGLNFHGSISFLDENDHKDLDRNLGIDTEKTSKLLSVNSSQIGSIIRFSFKDGISEVQINKPKRGYNPTIINYNFEFEFTNIDEFLNHLNLAEDMYNHFLSILNKLNVEVEQ